MGITMLLVSIVTIILLLLPGCATVLPKTTVVVEGAGIGWSTFLSAVVEDAVDWVVFIIRLVIA